MDIRRLVARSRQKLMWSLFAAFAASQLFVTPNDEHRFVSWMKEHNYAFVGEEYQMRLGIFMANFRLVQEQNTGKNYRLSVNKFAALTPAEYRAKLSLSLSSQTNNKISLKPRKLPNTLDWRDESYVPPIVDSGYCASWAFASVVPFSHIHYKSTQNQVTFSPWNLIDCSTKCESCMYGSAALAWEYVKVDQNGAINTLADYQEKQGECHYDETKAVQVMTDYAQLEETGNETALQNAVVTYGPVISSVDASVAAFQLYCGGIFDDSRCSSVAVNHQLAVIGYGNHNGFDYWLCQNFWGTGWGENGYIRITRGKNVCGIATYAWFVY